MVGPTLADRRRHDLAMVLKGPNCGRTDLARAVMQERNASPKRLAEFKAVALECIQGRAPTHRVVPKRIAASEYRVYEPRTTEAHNSAFHALIHAKHIFERYFPVTNSTSLARVTRLLRGHVIELIGRSKKLQNAVTSGKHASSHLYRSQFLVPNGMSRGQFSWRKYGLVMKKDAWGDFPEVEAVAQYLNCDVHIYRRIGTGYTLLESYIPGRGSGRDVLRILRVGASGVIPTYYALWPAILANYQTGPVHGPTNGVPEFLNLGGAAAINSPKNMMRVVGNNLIQSPRGATSNLNNNNNNNNGNPRLGPRPTKRPLNNATGSSSARTSSGSGRGNVFS